MNELEIFKNVFMEHVPNEDNSWRCKHNLYLILEQVRDKLAKKDHCQCKNCKDGYLHWSDCAVHNAPAEPVGECDCDHEKLNKKES